MHSLKMIAFLLASLLLVSLTGCGGGTSGTTSANSPFSTAGAAGGTIFGNISTAAGKTGITLTTDLTTVDVNNGQVLASAKLIKNGAAVSGVPVTFSIVEPFNGPATIESGLTIVSTDSNGMAVTRITTGNTLTTTSVIVQATATISGQTATANATFQIVRGNGVIMFTDAAGTAPSAQKNQLPERSKDVNPAVTASVTFLEQLPFKATDANGNPRVGVPIALSVYSKTGATTTVTVDKSPVTTDSAGMGIFNVSVNITSPPPGSFTSASIIYQAVTSDVIPVSAYVGGSYSLTSSLPTLTISPAAASFGTATDLTFVVSGGVKPYNFTSDNPGRVTVIPQADGVTVIAHLVDVTAWTGSVTISATDSAGQLASASVTR